MSSVPFPYLYIQDYKDTIITTVVYSETKTAPIAVNIKITSILQDLFKHMRVKDFSVPLFVKNLGTLTQLDINIMTIEAQRQANYLFNFLVLMSTNYSTGLLEGNSVASFVYLLVSYGTIRELPLITNSKDQIKFLPGLTEDAISGIKNAHDSIIQFMRGRLGNFSLLQLLLEAKPDEDVAITTMREKALYLFSLNQQASISIDCEMIKSANQSSLHKARESAYRRGLNLNSDAYKDFMDKNHVFATYLERVTDIFDMMGIKLIFIL